MAGSSDVERGLRARGVVVQDEPAVYLAALPGRWLLERSTPSWRSQDREKGFQRIVKESRARAIAHKVLEEHRTFPNAIILATKAERFTVIEGELVLPESVRFLVVDGQHRLWAQKWSDVEGTYPCVVHMDRTERDMAELFLEINDNQRRVPSSLRWDLVRLVRSEDPSVVLTADVVHELATRRESPFFGEALDLTGERPGLAIRQGSLAPEIRNIVRRRRARDGSWDLESWTALFVRFFVAIKSVDPGWGTEDSVFFKARVLSSEIPSF